ncbi:MAG TPA: thioesterase family protein [Candidatus Udaeobacter sp.]|nr:thioesterase family protein [Candidatus Udaeobacter sp.]
MPWPVVAAAERVRYAETDGMGVAYHSNFLIWFEIGRTTYMREVGSAYRDLEAAGYFMPVLTFQGELRESLRYDDQIEIRTSVTRVRSRQVDFAYEIVKDGRVVATGSTSHICLDRDMRPVALPPALRSTLLPPTVKR